MPWRRTGHPTVHTIFHLDADWLTSFAGAPAHEERSISDLIFEMLGGGYRLLLGGMFAAGFASLFTPFDHDTVAPLQRACQWEDRLPEQTEYREQADRALQIQEQADKALMQIQEKVKALQIAQRRRRRRTECSPGGFSPLARLVLEREMIERLES